MNDKMDGTCSSHVGDKKSIQRYGGKKQNGRDSLENLDVNGKIILEWMLEK
jgi:hypothetical protein